MAALKEKKYYLGIFYYNPDDERTVLPKRNPMLGWTFNFAKPLTYVFLLVIFLVILVAVL